MSGLTSTGRKVAIVDTMVFLHWPMFTGFDWKALVEAPEVEVVIPSVVYYELDKHKDQHPHNSIRKRARKVLLKIEELLGSDERVELAEGVTLHLDLETFEDYEEHHLSEKVKGDGLLLTALHRRSNEADQVVIVSGDSTMRTKARRRSFAVFSPLEEMRIEDPLDDYQRRMADLNQQLADARSRDPRLQIAFASEEPVFRMQPPFFSVDREAYLGERMKAFGKELSPIATGPFTYDPRNPEAIAKYNLELKGYWQELRESLSRGYDAMLDRERAFWCNLKLVNTGGGPARSVRIRIDAPEGVRLYDENFVPGAPSLPDPPSVPSSPLDGPKLSPWSLGISPSLTKRPPAPKPDWTVEGRRTALLEVESVIQHAPKELPGLAVLLEDTNSERGFHLDVTITGAELTSPVVHKLHFIYTPPDRSKPDQEATTRFIENLQGLHMTKYEHRQDFERRRGRK